MEKKIPISVVFIFAAINVNNEGGSKTEAANFN